MQGKAIATKEHPVGASMEDPMRVTKEGS